MQNAWVSVIIIKQLHEWMPVYLSVKFHSSLHWKVQCWSWSCLDVLLLFQANVNFIKKKSTHIKSKCIYAKIKS